MGTKNSNWRYGTLISRVKYPQLTIYFPPFIGVVTIFISGRGPPCNFLVEVFQSGYSLQAASC